MLNLFAPPSLICIFLYLISLISFAVLYYKLRKVTHFHQMKSINLYLEKKFIGKLLNYFNEFDESKKINIILDDIISYYGLDMIAIKVDSDDKIIIQKSNSIFKFFTNSEISNILDHSFGIEGHHGWIELKKEKNRHVIIFKNSNLSMMVVTEYEYDLSKEERDSLLNEIMSIIRFAIIMKKDKKANLAKFA